MTDPIFELHDVCKRYPGFTLGPLSLALPRGCILGLVGENGAGKTTTIKMLLQMIQPDSGSVHLLGEEHPDSATLRERIGVVLDEPGLPGCLSPVRIGNVMAGIYKQWDAAQYAALLRRLDLPEKKDFKDFSRGMKMKLSIAVALSHGAQLLVLDEATSGLDPIVREEVLELFFEFTRDETHSVLLSSHITSDLEKICDYIAFLHKGQLMLMEEKDRLYERYGLWHGTPQELSQIPTDAILFKRESAYQAEAILQRSAVPDSVSLSHIDIEQLFIAMSRKEV